MCRNEADLAEIWPKIPDFGLKSTKFPRIPRIYRKNESLSIDKKSCKIYGFVAKMPQIWQYCAKISRFCPKFATFVANLMINQPEMADLMIISKHGML